MTMIIMNDTTAGYVYTVCADDYSYTDVTGKFI